MATVTQEIDLNLTKPAVPEIVHVKQYDDLEREIICRVFADDTRYTIPTDATITVSGKKPDGTIFEYNSELTPDIVWVKDNAVHILVPLMMTTVKGRIFTDVTIATGDTVIGVFPYQLWVEKTCTESEYISSGSYSAVLEEVMSRVQRGEYTFDVGEGLRLVYSQGGSSGLVLDMWEVLPNNCMLTTKGLSMECGAEDCTQYVDTYVWTITELYSENTSSVMQASEFVFYNGDEVLSNNDILVYYSALVNGGSITTYNTEPLSQLFDDDTSTKVGITNYAAPLIITMLVEKGTDITGYGFYTGKDSATYPQRDPVSWTLSKNGEIIDTQSQVEYTHSNCVLAFKGDI